MSETLRFRSLIASVLVIALTVGVSAGLQTPSPTPEATLAAGMARLGAGDAEGAARILEEVVVKEPKNGRAWRALGAAQQQGKEFDRAIEAWRHALEVEPAMPMPLYNIGVAYAAKGDADRAIEWLGKARATGKIDMTRMEGAAALKALRADPRFAALVPTAKDFEDPFVEPTTILREWTGEASNDQFGWIARNIGDVDDDGVPDVVTSAPTRNIGGRNAGRVYVYLGGSAEIESLTPVSAGAFRGLSRPPPRPRPPSTWPPNRVLLRSGRHRCGPGAR